MKLKIEIETSFAAFGSGTLGDEIGRILRKYATRIEGMHTSEGFEISLADVNGKTVGKVTCEE